MQPRNESATRTLIIVHRRELLEQAARHCEQTYPQKTIEIEMANSHASGSADITIASIQTLVKPDRLVKFQPDRFKLILVDEVHHIVANTYLKVMEHFGLRQPPEEVETRQNEPLSGPAVSRESLATSPILVGVTATASRFDGLSLGAALDQIVYHKDFLDMIEERWLSPVKFTTVRTFAKLDKVRINKNGDFATSSLSTAVRSQECNDVTVRTWLKEAKNRKSTLVFCVDVAHVLALQSAFRNLSIDARSVTGRTTIAERTHALDSFKKGDYPVLLNCGVFTEGTDIPNVDCVLLARPTRSRNLLIQMIGRGLRLHTSKRDCLVIDLVAAATVGVITTPSLFGLDPDALVKNANIESLKDMRNHSTSVIQDGEELQTTETPDEIMQTTKYRSVYELIDDTSSERHIRTLSNNAWVAVNHEQFVLGGGKDSGKLSIAYDAAMAAKFPGEVRKQDRRLISGEVSSETSKASSAPTQPSTNVNVPELWKIYYRRPMKEIDSESKIPFTKASLVAKASNFEEAVHAADTYAADVFQRFSINTYAPWRKSPASDAQIAVLNRMRSSDDPLTPHDITKGRAMDMIAKIRNGVKGRFDKAMAHKQREEKINQRQEDLMRRDIVSVGPLNFDATNDAKEARPS